MKNPREFWIKEQRIFPCVAYENEHGPGLIHVREVLPSDAVRDELISSGLVSLCRVLDGIKSMLKGRPVKDVDEMLLEANKVREMLEKFKSQEDGQK